jgi:hypothetical protein
MKIVNQNNKKIEYCKLMDQIGQTEKSNIDQIGETEKSNKDQIGYTEGSSNTYISYVSETSLGNLLENTWRNIVIGLFFYFMF